MFVKLLLITTLATQIGSIASCPSRCTCTLDTKGRKLVSCTKGGMTGSVNLDGVALDTEVLKISAPEDNMNDLHMSPILQSYKKLEEIHITRSNIPQLGLHFFYGLKKLDVLNLSENNITQTLPNNFRGLDKLKELYLDDNRIHSLPSNSFQYLKDLKVLSVQRNRLSTLVISLFHPIPHLKVLKLSGNNLRELNPEAFLDIKDLRVLECRGCGLYKLDAEVNRQLSHLTHLDLGDNEIKSISSDELAGLRSLKTLKLDGNRIRSLSDGTFVHQAELSKLNLAKNEMMTVSSGAFLEMSNLTELDLANNRLVTLENGSLAPVADNLEVLILTGNKLKFNSLQELMSVRLKELYLHDCGIAEIYTKVFPDSLTLLDLSNNRLFTLLSDVLPTNLTTLDLSNNKFRGLGEQELIALDNIKHVKLDKNPWSCDLCYIIPMLDNMNRSAVYSDITCKYPYTMRNRKLGTIQRNELTWCTASTYYSDSENSENSANFFFLGEDGRVGIVAAGMSVCLLVLTCLVIVGAFFYSRRHAAKYYTHEDKLAKEGESILDNNHSPLFCDRELSFSFPSDKKISISTIDEIAKKEHVITNGT
ncbi:leucine-rich repeats and immunoglobulin-like domains protein 1 isoform X2 [Aethina tumida]|nr:leucine-rich repeats and immunoglobulin-like domains protein 1 isoform X2 [Aethina tumida]